MTTEVKQPDGENAVPDANQQEIQGGPKSLEDALKLIEHLKGINTEVIKTRDDTKGKLRKFEQEHMEREQNILSEQGKFKELYEQQTLQFNVLKDSLKSKAIEGTLKDELLKAGARSVDTVSKLIDKSKLVIGEDFSVDISSIHTQIEELKKTDTILFGIGEGENFPPVKRPNAGSSANGYEQDMRAAKSQSDIMAVMKKYGKI